MHMNQEESRKNIPKPNTKFNEQGTSFSFTVHCPAFLLIKISLKMHPYSPDLTACPIAKYIKCVTLFVLA